MLSKKWALQPPNQPASQKMTVRPASRSASQCCQPPRQCGQPAQPAQPARQPSRQASKLSWPDSGPGWPRQCGQPSKQSSRSASQPDRRASPAGQASSASQPARWLPQRPADSASQAPRRLRIFARMTLALPYLCANDPGACVSLRERPWRAYLCASDPFACVCVK